ncbi:hypothetical protein INR49_002962 [Caranx melampygus]|nr:hypothetical protein INR49_002962 [Caranx melampygus]
MQGDVLRPAVAEVYCETRRDTDKESFHPVQHGSTDLKDIVVHQDDGLEGGSAFVGQLMEHLLLAPALLQQGVTHHAGRAFEARAEVEGDVGARLGAAAARQVDLKPAERTAGSKTAGPGPRDPQRSQTLSLTKVETPAIKWVKEEEEDSGDKLPPNDEEEDDDEKEENRKEKHEEEKKDKEDSSLSRSTKVLIEKTPAIKWVKEEEEDSGDKLPPNDEKEDGDEKEENRKEKHEEEKKDKEDSSLSHSTKVLIVGAVALAPVVLGAIGFTSAGIAASSYAASMMSAAAIANGGGVAAGSLVAVLQSAGAAGLSGIATTAVAGTGGTIGGVLGGLFGLKAFKNKDKKKDEEDNKDNKDK